MVITIARAFGSGGAEVGRRVASRLGFYYADRQVLSLAAKRLGIGEAELELREERITSLWSDIRDVFALGPAESCYTPPPLRSVSDQEIFDQERRIMKVLARRHDCVIIGRGGRYVFADDPDALHVLLHAPLGARIARVIEVYGVSSEDEAARLIERSDRAREAFRAKMTMEDPWKATHYHLCIDTGGLGLDRAADLVIAGYQARFPAKR